MNAETVLDHGSENEPTNLCNACGAPIEDLFSVCDECEERFFARGSEMVESVQFFFADDEEA